MLSAECPSVEWLLVCSIRKVFNAIYDQGADRSLALFWFDYTVAAKCMKMVVVDSTPNHHTTMFLYRTECKIFEDSFLVHFYPNALQQ